MKVKIINSSENPLPSYATTGSAGMDICSTEDVTICPGGRCLVRTGLRIALPEGYEAQIRPRSGLSLKHGITVLNSPGTVDSDYRGEIGVILCNLGKENFTVHKGDRIAQMVVARHETVEWSEASSLDDTDRGEGGFGHSGK